MVEKLNRKRRKKSKIVLSSSLLPDFSWYMTKTGRNVPKVFQMPIKHINIFQSKDVKNLPKFGFFENQPSGNPALRDEKRGFALSWPSSPSGLFRVL
jgi:hypothetical protein